MIISIIIKKIYFKKINLSSNRIDEIFKNISIENFIAGEIIIDEYIFGNSKVNQADPIIVLNEKYTEQYLGGTAAVVNLKDFSKNIFSIDDC